MREPDFTAGLRALWFEEVADPAAFAPPVAPYACLLWAGAPTAPGVKAALAERLVATGCAFAVCGGAEAEAWHDAVDEAHLEADMRARRPLPDLTTTWHDGEPPDDVAFFFARCTGGALLHYVVAFVEADPAERREVIERLKAHAGRGS